jgi:cytochrome c-type biogenesis protein
VAKQKTNWDNLVENISQNEWYDTILDNKVLFGIGTVVMLILAIILYGMVGGNNEAPDFTLRDTEGVTFSLSEYEGKKVVILDFMFSTCEPCEKLVKEAIEPYSKKMDNDEVVIISVSVFGEDSEKTLREYADGYGWRHALDIDPNNSENKGEVTLDYKVTGTPKIFIIDKKGEMTYSHTGPISENELANEVKKAQTGQGGVVNLQQSSIFLFAVGAGVMVFFSPCSFPMLPGYMSFYLANKKQRKGKFDETAARETLPDGLSAAAGLMSVLLLIGILLIPFAEVISQSGILGSLEVLIGLLLAGLGIVMVMEYDSEKIVRPFRNLLSQIGSSTPMKAAKNGIEKGINAITGKEFSFSDSSDGTRVGLFWYGVAYGSAAAGCVAPVVIGLLVTSIGKGIITGLLVFLIFSITAGALMVAFTMMVAASESTIVDRMKASTRQIEMAGGVIMIVVGIYLMLYSYI